MSYEIPNNASRRKLAKQLGLLKKRSKLPYVKWLAEITRSQAAGKEIHRQKTQEMYRSIEEQMSIIEDRQRIFEESLGIK